MTLLGKTSSPGCASSLFLSSTRTQYASCCFSDRQPDKLLCMIITVWKSHSSAFPHTPPIYSLNQCSCLILNRKKCWIDVSTEEHDVMTCSSSPFTSVQFWGGFFANCFPVFDTYGMYITSLVSERWNHIFCQLLCRLHEVGAKYSSPWVWLTNWLCMVVLI